MKINLDRKGKKNLYRNCSDLILKTVNVLENYVNLEDIVWKLLIPGVRERVYGLILQLN